MRSHENRPTPVKCACDSVSLFLLLVLLLLLLLIFITECASNSQCQSVVSFAVNTRAINCLVRHLQNELLTIRSIGLLNSARHSARLFTG